MLSWICYCFSLLKIFSINFLFWKLVLMKTTQFDQKIPNEFRLGNYYVKGLSTNRNESNDRQNTVDLAKSPFFSLITNFIGCKMCHLKWEKPQFRLKYVENLINKCQFMSMTTHSYLHNGHGMIMRWGVYSSLTASHLIISYNSQDKWF